MTLYRVGQWRQNAKTSDAPWLTLRYFSVPNNVIPTASPELLKTSEANKLLTDIKHPSLGSDRCL